MKNNVLSLEELERNSEILKALAHPVRLCIAVGLLEKGTCNVSTMYSCLGKPQSTISQHLAKLKSVGIIKGERKGLEIIYSLQDEFSKNLIKFIANTRNIK